MSITAIHTCARSIVLITPLTIPAIVTRALVCSRYELSVDAVHHRAIAPEPILRTYTRTIHTSTTGGAIVGADNYRTIISCKTMLAETGPIIALTTPRTITFTCALVTRESGKATQTNAKTTWCTDSMV